MILSHKTQYKMKPKISHDSYDSLNRGNLFNTSSKSTVKIQQQRTKSYEKNNIKQQLYRSNLRDTDPEKYLYFVMQNKERVNSLKGFESYHEQVLGLYIINSQLTSLDITEMYPVSRRQASMILHGARVNVKKYGREMCSRVLKKLSDDRSKS